MSRVFAARFAGKVRQPRGCRVTGPWQLTSRPSLRISRSSSAWFQPMWPRLGWSTVTAAVHPKEAVVMSADARRPHDSELTDLIEDAGLPRHVLLGRCDRCDDPGAVRAVLNPRSPHGARSGSIRVMTGHPEPPRYDVPRSRAGRRRATMRFGAVMEFDPLPEGGAPGVDRVREHPWSAGCISCRATHAALAPARGTPVVGDLGFRRRGSTSPPTWPCDAAGAGRRR